MLGGAGGVDVHGAPRGGGLEDGAGARGEGSLVEDRGVRALEGGGPGAPLLDDEDGEAVDAGQGAGPRADRARRDLGEGEAAERRPHEVLERLGGIRRRWAAHRSSRASGHEKVPGAWTPTRWRCPTTARYAPSTEVSV